VPVHCTGVGKVLLAQLPPPEVNALLARAGMPAQTPHTIIDPGRLTTELERIRRQGYAIDDAEQELGVRCVAVAVPGGPSMTALSVSGPETRLTWPAVEHIVPLLQTAAAALAGHLDSRGAMA
jgi:IclR family acetate operon transcriptional repressor